MRYLRELSSQSLTQNKQKKEKENYQGRRDSKYYREKIEYDGNEEEKNRNEKLAGGTYQATPRHTGRKRRKEERRMEGRRETRSLIEQ